MLMSTEILHFLVISFMNTSLLFMVWMNHLCKGKKYHRYCIEFLIVVPIFHHSLLSLLLLINIGTPSSEFCFTLSWEGFWSLQFGYSFVASFCSKLHSVLVGYCIMNISLQTTSSWKKFGSPIIILSFKKMSELFPIIFNSECLILEYFH